MLFLSNEFLFTVSCIITPSLIALSQELPVPSMVQVPGVLIDNVALEYPDCRTTLLQVLAVAQDVHQKTLAPLGEDISKCLTLDSLDAFIQFGSGQLLVVRNSAGDVCGYLLWSLYVKDPLSPEGHTVIALLDDLYFGRRQSLTQQESDFIQSFASKTSVYIYELKIHSDYQGKGLGTTLLNAFYEWAELQGNQRCVLDCLFKNSGAITFYKKQGFSEVTTIGDSILFQKDFWSLAEPQQ